MLDKIKELFGFRSNSPERQPLLANYEADSSDSIPIQLLSPVIEVIKAADLASESKKCDVKVTVAGILCAFAFMTQFILFSWNETGEGSYTFNIGNFFFSSSIATSFALYVERKIRKLKLTTPSKTVLFKLFLASKQLCFIWSSRFLRVNEFSWGCNSMLWLSYHNPSSRGCVMVFKDFDDFSKWLCVVEKRNGIMRFAWLYWVGRNLAKLHFWSIPRFSCKCVSTFTQVVNPNMLISMECFC